MMRKTSRLKRRCALILFALCVLLGPSAHAQVNFVQITDPHVFDDADPDEVSRLDNKAAFASFVEQINQRVSQKAAEGGVGRAAPYNFVVVTGDLGIEQLVKGQDEKGRANKIRAGAVELASLIGLSKVGTWLFVPGNNDLVDENPDNIKYYYEFIAALRAAVEGMENRINIIDLCAEEVPQAGGQHAPPGAANKLPYRIGNYAFVGFNDASFKNSDRNPDGTYSVGGDPVLINKNFEAQKNYAARVNQQLSDKDIAYAYVFYHIPEIDDPFLVTVKDEDEPLKTRHAHKDLIGGSYVHSAWFVRSEVREEWNKVVMSSKVRGLFAGHFHDNKRSTYQNFEWLRTPEYLSDSLAKLHVCPPLALKKQKGSEEQARGFQEVHIDAEGKVSARIFWLEQAGWSLGAAANALEAASLRQLELGRTYEELDRLKEAEAAYVKAADSAWEPTRQKALASLRRVSDEQNSWGAWLRSNFVAPLGSAWVTGLTALLTAVLTALLTLGLVLFVRRYVAPYFNRRWKRQGENKLKIGPVTDSPPGSTGARFEQVALMVYGRIQKHFGPRDLIEGVPVLPIIAKSQGAEVANLLESVIPGGLGKYAGMLAKRMDQAQFSIQGVIQSQRRGAHLVFISLEDNGELLESWHKASPADRVIDDERDLAFAALWRLVRHVNK